ncbi:sigma-70 family RNA polymerase sigma factor [Alkalicoccus urumqiensis]|uniref:sigma-70 family RNA polymerase sigma factor n=1 Tax=Alkalicoccus urumqiensis TaxID=1548213 RepID=UPI0015E61F5C|nr:sigma-70 family RNA polymerase sigma factor [Alkalicoccus urumqiensis]
MHTLSFEETLSQFEPMIHEFIHRYRLYRQKDEALQTARIALYYAWNEFNPKKGDFAPYASSYIRGYLRHQLTRSTRLQERSVSMDPFTMDIHTAEEDILHSSIAIRSVIDSLPISTREKEWLSLYVLEGAGPSEAARQMNIKPGTAASLRKSALAKIRKPSIQSDF